MSTQYGTLSHHRTVQVPMWLIVALVVGMLAIAIGYTVEQYQGRGAVGTSAVTTIPDTQVTAREGGAVFPATVRAPCRGLARGRRARLEAAARASFPGTMVAAREGTSPQTTAGPEPIVVNGQICHQCR